MSIIQQRHWVQALQWEINRYNWDCFGTGTFSKQRTKPEARKLVEQYWQELEERLQSPLPRFWVLEPHQYRATPHLHFLVASIDNIEEDVHEILWRYWRKVSSAGRFASDEYDANRGGSGYLVKYLWKDVVDWDVANLDKVSTFEKENSLLSRDRIEAMLRKEVERV